MFDLTPTDRTLIHEHHLEWKRNIDSISWYFSRIINRKQERLLQTFETFQLLQYFETRIYA